MKGWFTLSKDERKEIINQVSSLEGLPTLAIEKDLWIVIALKAVFATEIANQLVFKGGTSLSKAWGLIERFSEDIDLAIDRSFFGFDGELTKSAVKKLRKTSCRYISEDFRKLLEETLNNHGVEGFSISVTKFEDSDTDPIAIEINYDSLIDEQGYLEPRVLVEISSRSLREPFENREISTIIKQHYPNKAFSGEIIPVPTVLPTRTLLEKMFLLHEEFQKPEDRKIRSHRMTRHLYDISRLMDSDFLNQALEDKELYRTIVKHRETLTNISWVDYSTHNHTSLRFIPPELVIKEWEEDYLAMSESMFYGETEEFGELMEKLRKLNERINNMDSL